MRCVLFFAAIVFGVCPAWGQTIAWSGYRWMVRDDTGGPGPNTFSPRNVSVDSAGALHLRLTKIGKAWTCAEIISLQKFAYGTYDFAVESRADRLDPNVVLGLFNYPDDEADGTNELDIEYSRWGDPKGPNLGFTAYPNVKHHDQVSESFTVHPATPATLNRLIWLPGSVLFQSLLDSGNASHAVLATWQTPGSFAKFVSHISMPVHLNLWLFESNSPSDHQAVEIVIKRFSFTPAP